MILEHLEGGPICNLNLKGQVEGAKYSEDEAQKYLTQLTGALDYLHNLNIVHGSIKPENILLTKDR